MIQANSQTINTLYNYGRFLYPILSTNLTKYYTDNIINRMPFLVTYISPNSTSPPYMAIPLSEKGIPVLIYENYLYDPQTTKDMHMNQFINTLDIIKSVKGNIIIVKTHNLSNAQYKELCRMISEFKAEKGALPLYVDIKYMNVGVDQVTQVQYQDMENRWKIWINEHNGREPQIIGIERKYQP